MDDFLDQFLFSPWSDGNATERSSWVGNGPAETNGLIHDSLGAFKADEHNSPTNLIPSSHVVESLVTQDASMLLGGQSSYGIHKGLLNAESQLQQGNPDHESQTSLLGHMNGNSKSGYMGPQLDNSMSTLCALNTAPSEFIPVGVGSDTSPSLQLESGSVGSNDCEQSEYQPTLRDAHSLTSIPQLWPPSSYGGVSSSSPAIGQDHLNGFGMPRQYLDTSATVMGNEYLGDGSIPRSNRYASLSANGQDELNNHCLSSFTAGQHIPLERTAALHSQSQLSQPSEQNPINHFSNQSVSQLTHAPTTAGGGCNGAVKPRVRARRGQATDPHSIAERLRREKIAERMKNLQELVPNSNKADKASMLDEIIDYVKFLQLQVKVLSMSRLGAAGAVAPLITDGQTEGSAGLQVSQTTVEGAALFESPDNLAFEQEVVKLMESNVTMAMQFLQSKGICLMPTALASAITGRKAPSSGSNSSERKKPILTNGLVHYNNGQPGIGTGQISSNGNMSEENIVGTCNKEDISTNGCNGAETVIKQEHAENNGYNSTGVMNPMHS